jgi:hypothetical protein
MGSYNFLKDQSKAYHIHHNVVTTFCLGAIGGTITVHTTQPFAVVKTHTQIVRGALFTDVVWSVCCERILEREYYEARSVDPEPRDCIFSLRTNFYFFAGPVSQLRAYNEVIDVLLNENSLLVAELSSPTICDSVTHRLRKSDRSRRLRQVHCGHQAYRRQKWAETVKRGRKNDRTCSDLMPQTRQIKSTQEKILCSKRFSPRTVDGEDGRSRVKPDIAVETGTFSS